MQKYTMNRPVVMITGATDGIGLALAQQYYDEDVQLVLIGRRHQSEISSNQSALQFTDENYCQTDLSQPDSVQQIQAWLEIHQISKIDCLIQNAGVGYVGAVGEQSQENIRQLLAVNLETPIALTHALLPKVTAAAGQIVFVSSVVAALPAPEYAVYGATKAALDGFVRNLRIELRAGNSPATVHLVRPGATRTGMHAKSGASQETVGWERFPTAKNVAAKIVKAIENRRSITNIGLGNHLLYNTGHYLNGMVEWGMRRGQRPKLAVEEQIDRPKHCVITGAADGIGKALAERFGQAGYVITGIDVDGVKAADTQAELSQTDVNIEFIITNLAEQGELVETLADLENRPPIDLFIHNAGINAVGHFAKMDLGKQQKVVDVNLAAPLLLTAGLLAKKRLALGGTVVGISSLSHFVGYPGAALYAASKDGLRAYLSSLAVALASQNINVLSIYPGPTRTQHARRYSPDNSREASRMSPEMLAKYIERAVHTKQRTLIPGVGNKLFALAGKLLPTVTERAMKRAILDQL